MEILVIRFSSLGDVILASGSVRALGLAQPDAHITLITKPAYQPAVTNIGIRFDLPALDSRRPLLSAWRTLRRRSFDYIFDLHGSARSIILSRLLRARTRRRIAKQTKRRQAMVKEKEGLDQPLSVPDMYREVIAPLLTGEAIVEPRLFLSEEEKDQVVALRGEGIPTLGIGWGARWATKAVPPRIWSKLFELLSEIDFGCVRIFGTESDRAAIQSFAEEQTVFAPEKVRIECGLDLRTVMTHLATSDVFLSSDSGLMHLASALGIPTFGLFGPTHPALGFAPAEPRSQAFHAGTWCSPCHRHGAAPCFRDRRHCFDELDLPRIADTVRAALAQPWRLTHESPQS